MPNLPRTQRNIDRTPREHCARCGRPLQHGTPVPGLGLVGRECQHHVAALQLALHKHGLSALLTPDGLRIELERHGDAYRLPMSATPLLERLTTIGHKVTWTNEPHASGVTRVYRLRRATPMGKAAA